MYAARAVPDVISGGWGVGGGKATLDGQKKGARNATKAHDTLLKQVSLGFNSTMFRQGLIHTAQSRAPLQTYVCDN